MNWQRCLIDAFSFVRSGWEETETDLNLGNLGAGWQARKFPFELFCMNCLFSQGCGLTRWRKRTGS